jgi:hypothetical protein
MERPSSEPTIPWLEEVRAQHEVLERISAEQKLNPTTAEERIAALKELQRSLALTPEAAEAWIRASRALRYGDDEPEE